MRIPKKLKGGGKDAFLGTLHEQLRQQAVNELASGKLVSPVNLDEVCDRILPALRKNLLTGVVLKGLGVEDSELRELLRSVLIEVGVELT